MTALTALTTLVSIGAVALTFRTGRKPTRIRPNLDLVRIAISAITIVVMTRVSPIETEMSIALLAIVLGGGGGFLIGRNAEIWSEDGLLWLKRSGLGLVVWGAGTVLLQVALMANRADLVDLGRFGSWFGIGMQIGVFVGRIEPLAVVRTTAVASVALVGWLSAPQPRQADAAPEARPGSSVWRLVSTDVGPMEGYTTVSHSPGSFAMTDVDERGFAAAFNATYDPPPDELEPGSTFEMNVSVDGQVTQGDVQRFSGLSFIQYSNRRWTDDAVSVGASCNDPIGAAPLACTEPESASGVFTWSVPSSGDTFDLGVGALNCDCAIHYVYEFDGGSGAGADTRADSETVDDLDSTFVDPFETDDLESVPSDVLGDPFGDESDDGLDEAEQAGLVGAGGTVVVTGLTLLDALDARRRRRDDGWDGGGLADDDAPDEPIVRADSWDPSLYDDEMLLDEEDTDSVGTGDDAFDDELAEWMENLPPPGEGWESGLGELLESMADQTEYWNRPFDPDELRDVWDALGRAVDDPGLATRDELQEALATLLDRNVAGMPAWLAAWAVRNPVQAAETIVRLGAAYSTGGVSELPWIPVDVYRDIDAARRSHPDGELTFGEAVIAGARGQAIGWVMDGGGRIFTGTGAIGDDLFDAAGGAASRAGREGAEEAFEQAGARFSREDLAEQAARGTDASAWNGIDDARPGTKIPPEHIRDTGYTPRQAAELQRIAAEENVVIGTRTTNTASTKWIEGGDAVPKPVYVKSKTINELDAAIGGPPKELAGQVGFFNPTEPPPGSSNEVWQRYHARKKEWDELKSTMDDMPGLVRVDEQGVVHSVEAGKPFAGDIDAVVILDKDTGLPLTGDRYERVVGRLGKSGAQLQHGAESHVVSGIVEPALQGKHPSSPEYRAAFDNAYDKAQKLADKLDQSHLSGAEQTVWTDGSGSYVGARTERLAEWQRMSRGDIPPRPVDMETMGLRSVLGPLQGRGEE